MQCLHYGLSRFKRPLEVVEDLTRLRPRSQSCPRRVETMEASCQGLIWPANGCYYQEILKGKEGTQLHGLTDFLILDTVEIRVRVGLRQVS